MCPSATIRVPVEAVLHRRRASRRRGGRQGCAIAIETTGAPATRRIANARVLLPLAGAAFAIDGREHAAAHVAGEGRLPEGDAQASRAPVGNTARVRKRGEPPDSIWRPSCPLRQVACHNGHIARPRSGRDDACGCAPVRCGAWFPGLWRRGSSRQTWPGCNGRGRRRRASQLHAAHRGRSAWAGLAPHFVQSLGAIRSAARCLLQGVFDNLFHAIMLV